MDASTVRSFNRSDNQWFKHLKALNTPDSRTIVWRIIWVDQKRVAFTRRGLFLLERVAFTRRLLLLNERVDLEFSGHNAVHTAKGV